MKKILMIFLMCPHSGWSQITCTFNVNFDSASALINIDTASTNIWQIGPPQKVPFQWSYSPPNAIVTDTINPYPPNNQSSFVLTIPANDGQCFFNGTVLTFWHKYDTDTLSDLCIMEQSWNHGITWHAITSITGGIDTFQCDMQEWLYDFDSLGNPLSLPDSIRSGNSNGWIRSQFLWTWSIPVIHNIGLPNYPDTVLIRFTFKSDSIHNPKAGWMIDEISVQHSLVGSVYESEKDNINISISPNPATNQFTIITKQWAIKEIEIYDVVGELVKALTPAPSPKGEGSASIDVSELASGIYFVRVRGEKTSSVMKLIKQ